MPVPGPLPRVALIDYEADPFEARNPSKQCKTRLSIPWTIGGIIRSRTLSTRWGWADQSSWGAHAGVAARGTARIGWFRHPFPTRVSKTCAHIRQFKMKPECLLAHRC